MKKEEKLFFFDRTSRRRATMQSTK